MSGAPPTAAATESPGLSPAQQEQVAQARDAVAQLNRAIKQIGMYRHLQAKYGEFLQKAHQAIAAYASAHGALTVRVDVTNLLLHQQPLFADDSPLPYKFFKDGIRQLIFRDGFTLDELVSFTEIALSDPDRGADDLNAQLWRAQLPHLEFIMAEGFRVDELGDDRQVQVEVDRVVSYLASRLRTDSDDYLRFARVSEEDLDDGLDGIEQIRGLVIKGTSADAALKAKVQKEITDEETLRLFPKLVSAVFQVVESGVDDPEVLEEMFVQLLDAMLLQEDFGTISQMLLKLRAMEQRAPTRDGPLSVLLKTFVQRMGDEQRLLRLGEILGRQAPRQPLDIRRYLQALDASAVIALLGALETVEVPESRKLLLEALAPFAKVIPDPFVNRLQAERPQTVRDMLAILDASGHPKRLEFLATGLKSQNVAIRLEVLTIIARGKGSDVYRLLAQCLDDPFPQVRVAAARALPELDREKAYLELLRLVKDTGFAKRTPEERDAFLTGLAATGVAGAVSYLQAQLAVKPGLFNKQKVVDDKLSVVHGLIGAATIQTYKLLQEVAEDKAQQPEVQSAARVGLVKVKRQLFGAQEGGGA